MSRITFGILFALMLLLATLSGCTDDDDPSNNVNNTNNTNNILDEVCDNGVDDDGDSHIDCDDPDCAAFSPCGDILEITILGTTDLHARVMGSYPTASYSPLTLDDDATLGGVARIAGVVNGIRAEKDALGLPVMLVDSGDFMGGDMVDLLAETSHPMLHFFAHMGYDAVTLGSSDLAMGPELAAQYINAVRDNPQINFDIPLLSSNLITSDTDSADDQIELLITEGVIRPYTLTPLTDDCTVGLFGKMGIEADAGTPGALPLTWWHDDPFDETDTGYAKTQQLVDTLRSEGADLVVHLSHQGINLNGLGEDRDVAVNVSGIDLIMSGHRHQILSNPEALITAGETYIVAAGALGEYLSEVTLAYNVTSGLLESASNRLHVIDDMVMGDATVAHLMESHIATLESEILSLEFGVTYSASPMAHTTFPFDVAMGTPPPVQMAVAADAMRSVFNERIVAGNAEGVTPETDPTFDGSLVGVAFYLPGHLGYGTIPNASQVTADDLYHLTRDGQTMNRIKGNSFVTFYVTPAELAVILNMKIETFDGYIPYEYALEPSGARAVYDSSAQQFQRLVALYLCDHEDPFTRRGCLLSGQELDTTDGTSLIRVGTDYTSMLLLAEARNALGEPLIINPKRKDGTPIDMADPLATAGTLFNGTPGDSNGDGTVDLQDRTLIMGWEAMLFFVSTFSDDWAEVELEPGHSLHYDEPTDGLPSFPSRIYNDAIAPTGEQAWWQLGLLRVIDETTLCSLPDMQGSHPLCL